MRLGRHQRSLLLRALPHGLLILPILNAVHSDPDDVLHVMNESRVKRVALRLVEMGLFKRDPAHTNWYRLTPSGRTEATKLMQRQQRARS